jgi:hypothetical protein
MKLPMILTIIFYTLLAVLFIGGLLHGAHKKQPNPFNREDE